MRHSRSEDFEQALRDAESDPAALRWSELSPDPNAAAVLARRAETLRAAWRPVINDRINFLEERCRGRLVLDIGCVAHDVERMKSPNWLHGRIAAVAQRCVGVDVLSEGVAAMQQHGYEVVLQDLGEGIGLLADIAPFDVIVAGELIEHVEALDMLFNVASEALAPDGEMIITTPNPYAPHRVRAAQLGIVWENVDHILYAFPSGIAELAERHGLLLAEAMTTFDRRPPLSLKDRLRAVKRRLLGRQWRTVGYTSLGPRRVQAVGFGPIGTSVRGMSWPGRRFLGETFVYVVKRPT
jgi:2-polyprenyl-3-methyl-5-hydroxy-6-metoxy-1,4-benzoquinol methylase